MRFLQAGLSLAFLAILVGASFSGATASQMLADASASPLALPAGQQLTYHCQWTQRFKQGIGWTGTLTMRVNPEGIINGTYKSTSIKPDPFYGKIVTVTGGLNGKDIRLSFGVVPSVTVRGEVASNGIQGSTSYNGGRVEFAAVPAQ